MVMRTFRTVAVLAVVLGAGASVAIAQNKGGGKVTGLDEPPFTPSSEKAARALSEQRVAYELINRASRYVSAGRADCHQKGLDRTSSATHDPPSQPVLDAIAALRRPATPEEAALPPSADHGGLGEVHVDHIRNLTAANGQLFTVIIARRVQVSFRISASCLDAQHSRLLILLKGKPRRIRSVTLQAFGKVRDGQEKNNLQPTTPQDGIFLFTGNGGGGGGPIDSFRRRGNFMSSGASRSSRLSGLVPDGVASVTLEYPRRVSRGKLYKPTVYPTAFTRTVRVQQNVLSLRVPRGAGDAFPPRMVWRASDGKVLRIVRQP